VIQAMEKHWEKKGAKFKRALGESKGSGTHSVPDMWSEKNRFHKKKKKNLTSASEKRYKKRKKINRRREKVNSERPGGEGHKKGDTTVSGKSRWQWGGA